MKISYSKKRFALGQMILLDIGEKSLSFDYFGSGTENLNYTIQDRNLKVRWNWGKFKTTEGFPINDSY